MSLVTQKPPYVVFLHVWFVFVFQTNGRTSCMKLIIAYLAGPGGSKILTSYKTLVSQQVLALVM